eukprot:TRINITY_DN14363_c0_g1_i1.p1 TRINITY_DN14363_c0_g1~~TRINITY_DN14363_c0_g1_i1.p1  ORF type:complete len:122 (-),score=13.09 TRINITY_DN14363_c0_g1_i1:190-522(-)
MMHFSRRNYLICPPSPRPRPHIDINYSSFTIRWNQSITGPEDCLDWGSHFNERNDIVRNFKFMFSGWKMRTKIVITMHKNTFVVFGWRLQSNTHTTFLTTSTFRKMTKVF